MLRIALLGHATRNGNLGVGALTVAEVEILRGIARRTGIELEITVLDGAGTRPACVSGPDLRERPLRPLRRPDTLFAALRQSDLVIDISGGDSFADIYGRKRLAQILLQKYLAHLARRPLVMAPQTVGPFRGRPARRLAAQAIRRSALVATRDDASTEFLGEMGVAEGAITASDVALRLPYTAPAPRGEGPVRVGLNVSGLLMRGASTGNDKFGIAADYPAAIRELIRRFLAHPEGCELHLVGHVMTGEGAATEGGLTEDDHRACAALAEEFPGTVLAPAFDTPSEAKSHIAGMDFFAGARMHACIAAFSAGVPVVAMAYSRKFAGLFGSLGYHRTVDCRTAPQAELVAQVLGGFESRAAARTEGLARLDAYEAALEALLLRCAGRAPAMTGGAPRPAAG